MMVHLVLTSEHLEALRSGEMTFKQLVNEGIVEWVDAEEEEDLLIAPRPFVLPETVESGPLARPSTHQRKRSSGPTLGNQAQPSRHQGSSSHAKW